MNLETLLLASGVAGALFGCLTGLLPGLHVNTLSVILLAAVPAALPAARGLGLDDTTTMLASAALILAITVSHTFVNIIPATFLGAPDETTSLGVLPAHRLLLRGQGYRAVALATYTSFFAVVVSLLLIAPARWLLVGPPQLWAHVRTGMPWLLLALVSFLVLRERACLGPRRWPPALRRWLGRLAALNLLLAAGLYGLLALRLPYAAHVPLPPSPLLPMLSGLFGAATLVEALSQHTRVPHQFLRLRDDRLRPAGAAAALGVGLAAGASMSLLPGLTNSTATAVASAARRGTDAEILVSLGAVNTANAVFNLVVLYLFHRARSGAVVALERLVPLDAWTGATPETLLWFLFVALAAALVSLAATLALGRWAARRIWRVPYRPLVAVVLAYLLLVVFVFSGATGLLVFGVGAALGLVPVRLGLQRSPLTGVLLVPVLGYFWA